MPVNVIEQGNKAIGAGSELLSRSNFGALTEAIDGATPSLEENEVSGKLLADVGAPRLGQKGFGDVLGNALANVNQMQVEANRQAELLATGQADNPHDAVIAMEKAHLALQLTVNVVEKALGAYKQISQMQI